MPIYKAEDYAQVIKRIKNKIADAGIPMGEALSEQEIAVFEEQNGIRLPEAYRLFLQEVGDGCDEMLDGCRLSSLKEIEAEDLAQPFRLEEPWIWEDEDIPQAELHRMMKDKLGGQFELIDVGCCMTYNLIVTGPCRGEVWSLADVGAQPCCERQDFLGWFELWLDMQDETDYFKDYES